MINPYQSSSPVVGTSFYNRENLLQEILTGPADSLWIIGNRRVGKTSLLTEAKHQTINSDQYLPLFWDMIGNESEEQFMESLVQAVDYAQAVEDVRWQNMILPKDISSISHALDQIAGHARKHHCHLLLLCDETEGFYRLGQHQPYILLTLRRTLQHNPDIRTILTSTRLLSRLYTLQQQQDTSIFLEGFEPRYLVNFDNNAANQIIRRSQSDRPLTIDETQLAKIRHFSGNHPLILQKVCSQLFNLTTGTLNNFDESEFIVDYQLDSAFQQDFNSLSPDEARVLLQVSTQDVPPEKIEQKFPDISKHTLRRILHDLAQLGFLRRVDGTYRAGNVPLGQWLTSVPTHQTRDGVTNQMTREISQERLISLQRQLITYTRHLEHLKIVQAKQGLEIPKIEEYKKKILGIEAELSDLGENIPASVFVSHSRKDEEEKDRLLTHLAVLEKNTHLVAVWSDDKIDAGAESEDVMNQAIAQAKVAILLITADFLASDFIVGKTMPALLKRRQEEGLVIFPVIARACAWKSVDWLTKMEVRPKNRKPVWSDAGGHVDENLASIVEEIKAIVSRGF